MSWDDHYRRRAAIKAVLDYARQHPAAGLPYDSVPEATQVFRDRHQLVLALQYDWSQALWARIELLALDSQGTGLTDAAQLAQRAWQQCAATHPVLRRLLDLCRAELGPVATQREQEMLSIVA